MPPKKTFLFEFFSFTFRFRLRSLDRGQAYILTFSTGSIDVEPVLHPEDAHEDSHPSFLIHNMFTTSRYYIEI